MSQNNQIKPEFLSDPAPLSSDEQAYLRTLLSEEDLEKCYEGHCEAAHRKLWTYFQAAASSLTLLYRERDSRRQQHQHPTDDQNDSLWQPFQSAAGSLTQLYRESLEGLRVGAEGVRRSGYQKCRRDLASWASLHRRRYIRRDELLRLLATEMEITPAQPPVHAPAQQQQPQPEILPPSQDQLFLQAFSAFPAGEVAAALSSAPSVDSTLPFSCIGRSLKRPHCATPPPPSSPSDKDVHMDTPTSKKAKPDSS